MEPRKCTSNPQSILTEEREKLITDLMKKRMYSCYEVCNILGISLQSLRRAIALNQIKTVRIGKRFLRIPSYEIENLLQGETMYLNVAEAADFLQVSHATIRSFVKNGQLRSFRFANKGPWKISKKDLERIAQIEAK